MAALVAFRSGAHRGLGYLTAYLVLAAFGLAGAAGSFFFKLPEKARVTQASGKD